MQFREATLTSKTKINFFWKKIFERSISEMACECQNLALFTNRRQKKFGIIYCIHEIFVKSRNKSFSWIFPPLIFKLCQILAHLLLNIVHFSHFGKPANTRTRSIYYTIFPFLGHCTTISNEQCTTPKFHHI